ncbi:MAG: DUF4783 domain-containing protein [Saprospiraceae bacterium]|nr:DUF4783 domain-containing protein [Saprospiraceae bacterium]
MKYISFLGLFFLSLTLEAQKSSALDAIGKSDMTTLASLLDNRVEICFDNKVQYLDKAATVQAIQDFLSKNPPKSCTPSHNGAAKGNASQYTIGKFVSTNGKSFRIFVFTSEQGGKSVIKEVKIDIEK